MREPIDILLVEDNPADALLVEQALESAPLPVHLVVRHDGPEALAYLQDWKASTIRSPLKLVLLDLNLPGLSGHDVLRTVRVDHDLDGLPIVILSSSDAEDDIRRSYELGADAYVRKEFDYARYTQMLHTLVERWLLGNR